MKAQHKPEKKRKPKSLDKKSVPKKQEISNFLANEDLHLPSKRKGIFYEAGEMERRSVRSQQGSRSSHRK